MKAEFSRTVARLAAVANFKGIFLHSVRLRLSRETALAAGKFSPYHSSWVTEFVNSVIEKEIDPNNTLSLELEANVTVCEKEGKCPNLYKEAFGTLAVPIMAHRVSYVGLRLGDYLSFFSSRVLSVSSRRYNSTREFLTGALLPEEVRLAEWLSLVTKDVKNIQNHLSALELARLLQRPRSIQRAQANYMGYKYRCQSESVVRRYAWSWLKYLGLLSGAESRWFVKRYGKVWQQPCINSTMDKVFELTGCCNMTHSIRKYPKVILKYMKYAIQPPHFIQSRQERETELEWIKSSFPNYEIKSFLYNNSEPWTEISLVDVSKRITNYNPRIFWSQYVLKPTNNLNVVLNSHFVRSYTNKGIGYTFNSEKFWGLNKYRNTYNQAFYDTMAPFIDMKNQTEPILLDSVGPPKDLVVVLQANKYDREELGSYKSDHTMILALHNPSHPPDLLTRSLEVKQGYETKISVTPTLVTASRAVKNIDVALRKCKFPSESEGLEIFQKYSQSGCLFECALRVSFRRCGCIPWNYPMFDLHTNVCDYMGVYCFELVS